jgi:hypothetical protein
MTSFLSTFFNSPIFSLVKDIFAFFGVNIMPCSAPNPIIGHNILSSLYLKTQNNIHAFIPDYLSCRLPAKLSELFDLHYIAKTLQLVVPMGDPFLEKSYCQYEFADKILQWLADERTFWNVFKKHPVSTTFFCLGAAAGAGVNIVGLWHLGNFLDGNGANFILTIVDLWWNNMK